MTERQDTNRRLMLTDPVFRTACELAGTPITKRQYSKYRNHHGKAYAAKHQAELALRRGGKDNG